MKRFTQLALACVTVLALVSVAAAQTPTPVVRIGDWVEIGNEAFMNIIATIDTRYYANHNPDFENDVQDTVHSRNLSGSSTSYIGIGDFLEAEVRWGVDMRYQKNLRMRVLFEAQQVYDGNRIDDRQNNNTPGCGSSSNPCPPARFGQNGYPGSFVPGISQEDGSPHVERYWIDYKFPVGADLHMRVGANLWTLDQAFLLGDDDPRFTVYGTAGPLEWGVAAVVQNESHRLGLANDNDFIYYTFHVAYNMRPHKIALDWAYFRDRYTGATGNGREGQKFDTVLIMPSWSGSFGPISALVQFNLVAGKAKGQNAFRDPTTGDRPSFDVFAYGVVAAAEVDLGIVRPFVGVIFGSADDDPDDGDLNGFFTMPQSEITLISGNRFFNYLAVSPTVADWTSAPADAILGGSVGHTTTGSPFFDRVGQTANAGINSAYSNPGTLLIPVGLRVFPAKGHEIQAYYLYVGMIDTSALEREAAINAAAGKALPVRGGSIDKTYYHEIGLTWIWSLSRHFDIRIAGTLVIPGQGAQDVASTVNCADTGFKMIGCEGEDPWLRGQARFRARF
jgi:hypothetical protein